MIAVIGAGLSGLTLAYRLETAGVEVEVYEARDRVGGRVLSAQLNGQVVELGGENICDGGKAKNLIELAEELGLKTNDYDVKYSSSIHLDNQEIDWQSYLKSLNLDIYEINKSLHTNTYNSLGDALNKLFSDQPILLHALRTRLTAYEGVDVDKQSIDHNIITLLSMLTICTTKESFIHKKTLVGGNAHLPLALAAKLTGKIYFGKVLQEIKETQGKLQLFFADESIISCDKVVLTVPINVYDDIKMPLEIIPKPLMGSTYKVIYKTNWKASALFIVKDNMIGVNGDGYYTLFFTEPSDNAVAIFKSLSKERIADPEIAQDQQFAEYKDAVTHVWSKDPYAKGSYSGFDKDSYDNLRQNILLNGIAFKKLFAPYKNKIFFAGEHTTILEEIGTMEAAVESGNRVAEYISKAV